MTQAHRNVGRWRLLPPLALVGAVVLLLAGVLLAMQREQLYHTQKEREIGIQAEILATTVSAAVAFNDRPAAQEYVAAFGVNPEIRLAAIYAGDGSLFAGFARPPAGMPAAVGRAHAPRVEDGYLEVVVPVTTGGQPFGSVLMQMTIQPPLQRALRYGAVLLLAGMAALLVVVLGATQATVNRANAALSSQADDLAAANRNLKLQIEEREKAEQALRQSQKMEALGQLTGGVAHDFNNLLQSLAGCLALVRRRVPDPSIAPILDAGQQAVQRGAKLTQQLLAFARRQPLRPQPVDVRDQLLGMSELLARALRADLKLEVQVAPDAQPVEVDPTQFELAILNLAVNARDAMPNGGTLAVEAANLPPDAASDAPGPGEWVRIAVRDSGTGMPPDVLARAFDPFFTTKAVGKGSGLGLSQVYGFARQSGGTARIDSTPGRGTTVSLILPRSQRRPEVTVRLAEPGTAGGEGHILLVEDDPIVGPMLGGNLEDLGFRVTRVATADEGLARLDAGLDPDIVLSDVVMPGEASGIDLARTLRRRRPDLPIVLMTGYSEGPAADIGVEVLSKPYTLDQLSSALRRAAGLAGMGGKADMSSPPDGE